MSITAQNYLDSIRELGLPDLEQAAGLDILNIARQEVVTSRNWPFRATSETGSAGVVTFDPYPLGSIERVVDTNGDLVPPIDQDSLLAAGLDLTTTASTPEYYYLSMSSSGWGVSAYPLASITVTYYGVPEIMDSVSDTETMLPDTFKMAVVYRAAMHGNLRMGVTDVAAEYGRLANEATEALANAYMNPFVDPPPVAYPSGP